MREMPGIVEDYTKACIELIGRTGAESVQLRYSDDEEPIVWFVVVVYPDGRWESDAGRAPLEAQWRMCERLIDGGECTHCHKVTALLAWDQGDLPLPFHVCAYRYDPELKTFRRSCEGDEP